MLTIDIIIVLIEVANMIVTKCLLFVVLVLSIKHTFGHDKKVLCYYGSWATYRHSYGKFDVANINVDLCTHLVYTFVGIDSKGNVISLDPYLDLPDNWGRNNFGSFNALKKTNPKLKTILAVGGWNEGSGKYSVMAANATLRGNFIKSAIAFLQTYGFDGLDLDWEYPNGRDSIYGQADVGNYALLLKELRSEFDKHGYILSAAVAATEDRASQSYNIPEIVQYLDIIGIMSYDFCGAWDSTTGHNSPLHNGEGDENLSPHQVYAVDTAVEYWLSQECPPEKLVIGLPLYGRTFILTDPNINHVRSPSSGAGIAGEYTNTNGLIGYNEFCLKLQNQPWQVRYDNLAKVPYAVEGRNWVSYDNPDSLAIKTQYAMSKSLGGVMVWSIETDDFHGLCGIDYPLLEAINQALDGTYEFNGTQTTPDNPFTPASVVSTQTTSGPIPPFTCLQEGTYPDLQCCSSFYECVRVDDETVIAYKMQCPEGLWYDYTKNECNWPSEVTCLSADNCNEWRKF